MALRLQAICLIVASNAHAAETPPVSASSASSASSAVAGTVYGELWQNIGGGQQSIERWNAFLDARADLQFAGRNGGPSDAIALQIHAVKNQRNERPFSTATGSFHPVSGWIANDHVRVFNLHYRRDNPDGSAVKIGQLAIDDDFMLSEFAVLFANASFGAMPSQVSTPLAGGYSAAFPIFPVAGPGFWWQSPAHGALTWQTAAYLGGPGPDTRSNHGFSYESARQAGVLLFSEVTRKALFLGLASTQRAGATVHTGKFDDLKAPAGVDNPAMVRGLFSLYLVQDVVLAKSADNKRRTGMFGRVGLSPLHDRTVVSWYADGGIVWFGPLEGRRDDSFGVGVSITHFGRHYRNLVDAAQTEKTVEITYSAQVLPRVAIQADMQLLMNPARNAGSGRRETATIVGLRTSLSF